MFGTPASSPAVGTPSTPSVTPAFVSSPSSTTPVTPLNPFSLQQALSPSSFQTPISSSSPFGVLAAPSPFFRPQITTQMAPVAPLPFSLPDRDVQTIVGAYKDDPGSPNYAFKHLLLSVTNPSFRVKPLGVSDIMWAEAMGKLEGMESADRERLWPQLVHGFKDLSHRLKLQDETMSSDAERLRMTQKNVKMIQTHFQGDTLPWIQRMRHREQGLQRRLLRVMRIVEALEGKGFRAPLTKAEVELAEKSSTLARQFKGPGAELSRRVHHLLSVSRLHATDAKSSIHLPVKIHEQSLADLQEVLQRQTEAIARLGVVLKRVIRDMEIIKSEEDVDMADYNGKRVAQTWPTFSIRT